MPLLIRPFDDADESTVIALWERCGLTHAWNNPALDIARKRTVQPDLFVVATLKDALVGSVMAGFEGHRGWVNYLAVDPSARGQGVGRALMAHVETALEALGCPKLNLQVRETNREALAFYRALGYQVDAVISLGKRLIPDN